MQHVQLVQLETARSEHDGMLRSQISRKLLVHFFPPLFPKFLPKAPYKIILFCHRLVREIVS